MDSTLLDILIDQLREKLHYYIKDGALVTIYPVRCLLSNGVNEDAEPDKKQIILLDTIEIVNAYEKTNGGFELDIGWQPAEFDFDEKKHNYNISKPMYHHIVDFEISKDYFKFFEIDPDRQIKRVIVIEPLADKKNEELNRKWAVWQDFKDSHPELFEDEDYKMKNIPWGKLVNHKGCE